MFDRTRVALLGVAALSFICVGSVSCDALRLGAKPSGADSGEELAARCMEAQSSYSAPYGSRSAMPQKTRVVARQLGLPSHAGRLNAARRILEHSECYESGILLGAIALTSSAGDPRPLRHLEEIATGRGYVGPCRGNDSDDGADDGDGGEDDGQDEDAGPRGNGHGYGHQKPDHSGQPRADDDEDVDGGDADGDARPGGVPVRIAYPTIVRLAAAAAIGRIVEVPRVPGGAEPADVDPGEIENAITALIVVAACPDESADLRAASIESLGIIRDPSAKPILDLLSEHPGDPNTTSAQILTLAAERSLTTILVNNHSAHSGTAEQLADLLRESREGSAP